MVYKLAPASNPQDVTAAGGDDFETVDEAKAAIVRLKQPDRDWMVVHVLPEGGTRVAAGPYSVASVIADQIGNRALRMIGATNLVSQQDTLGFKIRGSRKANFIRVTLEPSDTYTLRFYKVTKRLQLVAEIRDVYVEQLRAVIEDQTGLRTSL